MYSITASRALGREASQEKFLDGFGEGVVLIARHHVVRIRKVDVWTARYRLAVAEFARDPVDPFFNINRPDDLTKAEALHARLEGAAA